MRYSYEKAFQRHRDDLEAVKKGIRRDIRFNSKLANLYIVILESLKFTKGEKAGELFIMEKWQKKVTAILFGWEKLTEDSKWVRRFNTGFIFIPRKNGKTELGAGYTIADTLLRGEIGGEVAYFATKREQARIAYEASKKMMFAHEDIKKFVSESYSKTTLSKNETDFYTLGRDSKTVDGLNICFGLCDEYHAHPDNSLWEVVESSQGARVEPLMLAITTAGFNIGSPAYQMYEYAKKVLDGVIEDDSFFAFIAEAKKQEGLEWILDEEVWKEANPNYGVSIKKDFFKRAAKEAYDRPEKLNNFLVKHLNIWTTSSESFIPLNKWQECKGEMQTGDKKVLGNDLSMVDDFSALVDVEKKDDKFYLYPKFYIPEERIVERERELRVPLFSWVQQGYITATPGRVIDYDYIEKDIDPFIEDGLEAFCYDPWKAGVLVSKLEEKGYDKCIPIRQGYATLSAPIKWFLDLIVDGKIVHDGNPVLTWMISNVSVINDVNGNFMLDKKNPNKKIDGVAAIINALAYYIHFKNENTKSIYEERGLRSL